MLLIPWNTQHFWSFALLILSNTQYSQELYSVDITEYPVISGLPEKVLRSTLRIDPKEFLSVSHHSVLDTFFTHSKLQVLYILFHNVYVLYSMENKFKNRCQRSVASRVEL